MGEPNTKQTSQDNNNSLKAVEADVFNETVNDSKSHAQMSWRVKKFMKSLCTSWSALNQEERKDICYMFYHKFMVHVSSELLLYESLEYLEEHDQKAFMKFMELASQYFSKLKNENIKNQTHDTAHKNISITTSQLSVRFPDNNRKYTSDRFIKNRSFLMEVNDEYAFISKDLLLHMKNILYERNMKAEAMRLEFLSKMTSVVNSIDENVDLDAFILDYMKPINTLSVHFGVTTIHNVEYLSFAVQIDKNGSCEEFPVKDIVNDNVVTGGFISKKSVEIISNAIAQNIYGVYSIEFIEDTNVYILIPYDNK